MKNIAFASIILAVAVSFAPAAFAETKQPFKEKCAISHGGGNWNNAPDSCSTLYAKRHKVELLLDERGDHTPPTPSRGKQ